MPQTRASDISIHAYSVGSYMVMTAYQGLRKETVLMRLEDLLRDEIDYQRWLEELKREGK